MSHTFVIAEAGSCHDGSYVSALRLIDTANLARADACKFQFWSSAERLAERRNAQDYLEIYRKYALPEAWIPRLADYCEHVGLEFMCTVYLPEDIERIAPYVKRFKVASFEAQDDTFIEAHWKYDKEIIVSTGMQEEESSITYNSKTRYLHCVSAYPTPEEQANLAALRVQDDWFSGYSDHTKDVFTGGLAVAAGAHILEVHFRLEDTDPQNPDYGTALSPADLICYVEFVRKAERMLGDGVKKPQPAEEAMMRYRVRA